MSTVVNPQVPVKDVALLPAQTETGAHIFALLAKRTYDIVAGRCVRSGRPVALVEVDVYYDHGDPETTTVQYESDLAPYKIATDFVVIGKACAPGGAPVVQMNAGVLIANDFKVIRVIGDRCCIHRVGLPPAFTEPTPFTTMELRYDRAFGGEDWVSEPALPFFYPRNYRGTGIALKNIPDAVDGLALPNLEDPNELLTPERVILEDRDAWNDLPLPQGFGWFQKTWYPRCSFVGSIQGRMDPDTVMREETLGIVPRHQIALLRQRKLPSFDVRFNNGASLGLILPFLNGDEPVRLVGLTPEGTLDFRLPGDRPRMMMDIGFGANELDVVLHTVCVRLDAMQVDLVWRGAHEYPGLDWLPEMKKLEYEVL
jgi:hypothetical protein